MDPVLPDTIIEVPTEETLNKEEEDTLGMWNFPTTTNHEQCCIYRVPHRLRIVSPKAYTPQLVLIGPLYHYLKSQPLDQSRKDIINTKSMGYLNMEKHKKIYLEKFAQRFDGKNIKDKFRRIIEENENRIRESYSESTLWIELSKFVEMILLDSVFIFEHMLNMYDYDEESRTKKTGDLIVDDPCLQITIKEDLMLLENQLPYFILEKLFDQIASQLHPKKTTLHSLVLAFFGFQDEDKDKPDFVHKPKFIHFTDLLRSVRVATLYSEQPSKTIFSRLAAAFGCDTKEKPESKSPKDINVKTDGSTKPSKEIRQMYNAEKLHSAGIKFMSVKNENGLSIAVKFKNGCLKIPCIWVRDDMELILRNIMAFEQCHYPSKAYICNFVIFLDFLIDSGKDVDLLIEKEIIHNWMGEQKLVADMVNKLNVGIIEDQSCYFHIATKVNAYYESPINKTRAVLQKMYFSNLWRGTATVAAIILLVMTLIQTVASVIQAMQT